MSNMDGTSRKILAAKGVNGNGSIFWPVSLTYSKETKTIYWLDVLSQTIESISVAEPMIRISRKVDALYSQSMAVAGGKLYWTDDSKDTIQFANIDSIDKDVKVFNRSPEKKSFLKSLDLGSYYDHVETKEQMTCPGLWLSSPIGGMCTCGDGFSKNALGTACIKSPTPSIDKDKVECQPDEFNCKSLDECVKRKFICDGSPDCSDASDEQPQPLGPCPVQCFFKCDGSRCLEKHQVCNFEADCIDESDESIAQCHNSTESEEYAISYDDYCDEFPCDNGNCVLTEMRCDSVDNCGDGSDEKQCLSLEGTTERSFNPVVDDQDDPDPESEWDDRIVDLGECKPPDYYCLKNKKCISMFKICDGISDCEL